MFSGDSQYEGRRGYLFDGEEYAGSCTLASTSKKVYFSQYARRYLIRRFAREVAYLRAPLRLFLEQTMQLRPSLQNQRLGELPRSFLPFRRQILHSHVEQRNVGFDPAQGFLNAIDAVRRG